jgi:predicted dehydrogenase
MPSPATPPSRREFLVASAAAAGSAALPAASYARIPGANDRIRIGMIGVSPYAIERIFLFLWLRRKSHNCEVASVCDVYEPNLRLAAEKTGAREAVRDYRRVLENREIDAVVVAAPDHWHAKMGIESAQAGKDVYLEAPFTRTWQEAVELREAVARHNIVLQCGAQAASDDRYHQARHLIEAGAVGALLYTHTVVAANSRMGYYNRPISAQATPANLDWRMWLGPAPYREFDADRFVRWRKYWDYSGGAAVNLVFPSIAAMLIAVGSRLPRRVSAGGGAYLPTTGETPDVYFATCDYADFSMQIQASLGNEQGRPTIIAGHEGTIRLVETVDVVRERYFATEYAQREAEGRLQAPSTARPDHVRNWLECLRTREKPVCHEGVAESAMIAAHLGELSYRENRTLLFDADLRTTVDELAKRSHRGKTP